MKKRELEERIERLERDVWGKQRFVGGGIGALVRLERLERTQGEVVYLRERVAKLEALEPASADYVRKVDLANDAHEADIDTHEADIADLNTRLEKLEGRADSAEANIAGHERDLGKAGLILEGDKARQPETQGDFVQGTGWNKDKARQPERYWFEGEWWVKSYHSGVVGPGEVVLGRKDGRPYRWPKDGGGQSMKGWTLLRREGADRRLDDPAVARQPDEPMADMPETGPSDYKHFDGVDQAREWVSPVLYEAVVAERDQARTARDGVEQYWDRKYAATRDMCAEYRAELDRLREGLLRVADETEARFGQSKQVLDLRALLDGDDE